jgi:hypothetical protein
MRELVLRDESASDLMVHGKLSYARYSQAL